MKLSTVIVGLGQVGMGYDLSLGPASSNINTHAKACAFHSGFHLLSGVDPEYEKRRSFERECGVESYIDVKSAALPDVAGSVDPADILHEPRRSEFLDFSGRFRSPQPPLKSCLCHATRLGIRTW